MRNILPKGAIAITAVFFLAAGFVSDDLGSIWGFCHLAFLPDSWKIAFAAVAAVIVYVLTGPIPLSFINRAVEKIDRYLFGENVAYRIVFSLLSGVVFWRFMTETFLLGDGYTLLANLGQGDVYIHKWAEMGSTYLIRLIQRLQGGYTTGTAAAAFQGISVVSGIVFVYNLFVIAALLTKRPRWRIFCFATLFCSGYSLLFFGYVEFYPLTLAVMSTYLVFSLKAIRGSCSLYPALFLLLLAIGAHVVSIIFVPGMVCLFYTRLVSLRAKRLFVTLCSIIAVAGVAVYIWAYQSLIGFEILNLPFLKGRPSAPDYTVISVQHFRDLINLLFMVFPGLLVISLLALRTRLKLITTRVSYFLIASSAGSVAFLLLFGAAITMGRDWDIMSLALFLPAVLVFFLSQNAKRCLSSRVLAGYILLIASTAVLLVSVSVARETSEKRFATLLNERNRNMWIVFAQYYKDRGDHEKSNAIMKESFEVFPGYLERKRAFRALQLLDYDTAYSIAVSLVEKNPYEPDFLQLMGYMHRKKREYALSEATYSRAIQLKPYSHTFRNELGMLYVEQQKYQAALDMFEEARSLTAEDAYIVEQIANAHVAAGNYPEALLLADTLMLKDSRAGSYLIHIAVAIQTGDTTRAREYYNLFKIHGKDRVDYEPVRSYYDRLIG